MISKNLSFISLLSLILLLIAPITMAASITTDPGMPCNGGVFCFTGSFGDLLTPLFRIVWIAFVAIVVISFVVAGALFLTAQGNAEKLKLARQAVIWGVAGIIVGILAFSIITIIGNAIAPPPSA